MEYKTHISKVTKQGPIIRGENLSTLIKNNSFTDSIFLLLTNRKPNVQESKIFSAILISIIDHGMGTTSSQTTRFVKSGGNPLNTAVGAGVLALGNYHGGAIENAMKQIKTIKNVEEFVTTHITNKKIIFGFGHKIYKDQDPRVIQILKLCKEIDYQSTYIEKILKIEQLIEQQKGKKIILNIDGLIAAILLEMRFDPIIGKGIFIIGRTPGLVAQAVEESKEKPVRRISEEDIEYMP
jgi:citryl-CoA lyase